MSLNRSRRDELRLKYVASFGYVSLRVDIRGSGNSQGHFDDEYSVQELSDALEILQWIDKQSWSNGKVGSFIYATDTYLMIFNGRLLSLVNLGVVSMDYK